MTSRIRRLAALGLALGLASVSAPTFAQTNVVTFETVTFAATSIGFTAATIRPAGQPVMTVCSGKLETGQIRIRWDGTAPTATVGALIDIGDIVTVRGTPYLDNFRGIRTGASSGTIAFHCHRGP